MLNRSKLNALRQRMDEMKEEEESWRQEFKEISGKVANTREGGGSMWCSAVHGDTSLTRSTPSNGWPCNEVIVVTVGILRCASRGIERAAAPLLLYQYCTIMAMFIPSVYVAIANALVSSMSVSWVSSLCRVFC